MGLFEQWNNNKFSIYSRQEKTVLALLESFFKEWFNPVLQKIDENETLSKDNYNKKLSKEEYLIDLSYNRKLSPNGDFTGTWNGVTLHESEEGLASDWSEAKGTFGSVTQRLENVDELLNDITTINVKNKGAIADKTTDNTIFIQSLINSAIPPSIIYVPLNVKWDYRAITHPYNITIIDNSGYDWLNDDWTAQRKIIVNTDSPSTKNANEDIYSAPYHPALIVDNVGDGTIERRASTIYRHKGVSYWRNGMGRLIDNDFVIARFPDGASVFGCKHATGEIGFGIAPISGIPFTFSNLYDGNNVIRYQAKSEGQYTEMQFYEATTMLRRIRINATTGQMMFIDGSGATQGYLENDMTVYGIKNKVIPKTANYTIPTKENKTVYTNTGTSGGFTYNLPLAVAGLEYTFVVTTDTKTITINPQDTECFRGKALGKTKSSNVVGNYIKILCAIDGVWEVVSTIGTWTDEA